MADRTVSYNFRGNFAQLTAGLSAAGRSVNEFGNKLTTLDKNGAKMRAGLTTVGDTAGKVGLVAAAGFGAAILASARFDKAMSEVQAATHETSRNMDLLREAALKAGADTAFSATEAAGAIEELSKAGVATSDILGGGLSGALDLAAAGGLEVGEAAETAATALTQFRLSGEDVPHVADLLAAGAGKAQGSVHDLGMALKQSGLVASQTGLTIEETTGTLAAFASAGLIGSDAGTSFKTMLQSLTPSSKEAAELMAELGISAYDAQGNFIGMTEFAANLREGLAGLSVEQQNAAMKTIFGSDAVRAASVVFSQGADGIQDWIDKTNDAGYAAETAATRMDNLAGDWEEFTGSLETALIGAGDGSQGALRKLVQGATAAVNVFNDLPPAAQNTAMALAGITAVTGGGLWFGAKVITGIADTKQALDDLGFSGSKTAGVLGKVGKAAGIAGGALAAMAIVDTLQRQFEGLDTGIEGVTEQLLNLRAAGEGAALAGEFDSLADSFARLTDPNLAQAFQDSIYDTFGFLGSDSRVDEATAQFEAIDAALTNIAASGSASQAEAAFDALASSMNLTGGEQKELLSLLPNYQDALKGAENQATLTAGATSAAAGATQQLGTVMVRGAEMTKAAAKAFWDAQNSAKETARAFFGVGDAVNDSKVSLGEWIADMQKQAAALRDFRENAEQAANRGLRMGLIDALREAGPEGAMRMKQLANATDAEIGKANKAWRNGQREVQRYADSVTGVPKAKLEADGSLAEREMNRLKRSLAAYGATTETARAALQDVASGKIKTVQGLIDKYGLTKKQATALLRDEASGKLRQVIGLLNAADRDVESTIRINTIRTESYRRKVEAMGASADGGSVPKTGLPYADRHPYLLADGEEVISNRRGQADKWRPLLKAINAGRLADGGTVGRLAGGGTARPVMGWQGDLTWATAAQAAGYALADTFGNLADLNKRERRELEQRMKTRERVAQRELKMAEDMLSARKDELKALRDSRRAMKEQVAGNFMSDVFGDIDITAAAREGLVGSSVMQQVHAWGQAQQQAGVEMDGNPADWIEAYLATLPRDQRDAIVNGVRGNMLNRNTLEADRFQQALKQLKALGLDGGAFQALAESGNLSAAQFYAGQSREQIDQFEKQFNTRGATALGLGNMAAGAQFDKQIRLQEQAVTEAREERREANQRAQRAERLLSQLEKRLERIERESPKKTGEEVGKAVNGAVGHGQRSGK